MSQVLPHTWNQWICGAVILWIMGVYSMLALDTGSIQSSNRMERLTLFWFMVSVMYLVAWVGWIISS